MRQIASLPIIAALICSVYVVIGSLISLKTQHKHWLKSAIYAIDAIAGLFTLAVLLLAYFLLQRDFRFEYVANYIDSDLPRLYVLSALWAGQKGSLLFWGWVLALCSVVFVRNYTKNRTCDPECAYLALVLALILGFFLFLLAFRANPFTLLALSPLDGKGMNPLLQNPYMAIHPPVLFLGYAGFVIPFALAFVALCTGKIDNNWIRSMRRWTLFSWYFLGIGILLGARWAYLELGWGGYWSWDPVENSSFMPWLTSTALLHTLILQQRKNALIRWNIFLSMMTFLLCVFATFITRSGVLSSVHAYAESPVGSYFLAFLLVMFLCMAGLLIYRRTTLSRQSETVSLLSKENGVFLANQLFAGLGFAVLYGTIYPLLSELLGGKKAIIGPPFFNNVAVPIGLVMLGLIGVCKVLAWKHIAYRTFLRRLAVPIGITLVMTTLLAVFGMKQVSTLLACSLGIFVVSTILADMKTLSRPVSVFHLATAMIFIGIAVSATYKFQQEIELAPGESVSVGNFRFHYIRMDSYEDRRKGVVSAEIAVYKNEQKIAIVAPEKRFYGQSSNSQVTTEIGLHTSISEDVYVILAGWDENQRATFVFMVNPMILWIWIGGLAMFTLGMMLHVIPKTRSTSASEG